MRRTNSASTGLLVSDPGPPGERKLLLGCGILRKEIEFLVGKNRWPVETLFLDSALHVSFNRLSTALERSLARSAGRDVVVFYGACHPLMEPMLAAARTRRTVGQNCVDILLGNARFTEALASGAFFLLEDWVLRWESIMARTFGSDLSIRRDIFQSSHTHLLALKTPCSGDFSAEAEAIGASLSLPVRWAEVSLDPLERTLAQALFGEEPGDG
jgi:hypothetical protein